MIIETAAHAPPRILQRAETRPRSRRRLLPIVCGLYLVCLGALWILMREMGDRGSLGTFLLLIPRWPYAGPLLALWPWAIAARRWRPAAALLAATAVLVFLVMGYRVGLAGGSAIRGELRLLTCNVHREHLDAAQLAAYLAKMKPDVVALQGWSGTHEGSLFSGGDWQVRREGELLVASRFPIGEVRPLVLATDPDTPAGEQGAAALVELRAPRGPVFLLALHLASPHAGLNSIWTDRGRKLAGNLERRWRESDQVRALADTVHGPLLLAGDFNTTSESPIFREHWPDFADAFLQRGTGFGYTYLINHTQLRIDHILADASWEITRCWVGPDVNAAHRPLVADLNVR